MLARYNLSVPMSYSPFIPVGVGGAPPGGPLREPGYAGDFPLEFDVGRPNQHTDDRSDLKPVALRVDARSVVVADGAGLVVFDVDVVVFVVVSVPSPLPLHAASVRPAVVARIRIMCPPWIVIDHPVRIEAKTSWG